MTSNRNLMSYSISILNKIGIFNHTNSAIKSIILAVMTLGCIFMVIISSLQYFFMKNDINEYVSNLEATFGSIQILGKILICIIKKNSFLKLLVLSESLWKIDICSEKEKLQLNELHQGVLRFQKIFYTTVTIFVVGIVISIFFGRDLPLGIWKMMDYPKLYIFYKYTINFIVIPCGVVVCTSDMLFIGVCYTLIIQFRILCNKLDNLNFDQSKSPDNLKNQYRQFNICLEYHKFLLSYLKSIQQLYSYVFGIQYITSAPLVCAAIYTIWDMKETESLILVRNLGNTIYASFQLAFYCIPADLVVQEAVTVANALYNCNWYSSNNYGLKKSLQIAIQASQREYQFAAFGMVEFKPATVLSVIKISVSACTIFRQLENK